MSASPRGPVGVHVERGNQQRRIKVVGADGEVKGEVPHYAVVQALVEREGIATSLTPDALVEEELRAITVCEECREKPLSISTSSISKRRHTERPWICRGCAISKALAARTPEQRSETTHKRLETMTPERRSEAARKANAARTPEQRSEAVRRRIETMTPEQRSEASRKAKATMTPEQRSEAIKKANASRTQEQRSRSTGIARASMTTERRRDVLRKVIESMTPERRSDAARKAWGTKRAKQAANHNESTTGNDR